MSSLKDKFHAAVAFVVIGAVVAGVGVRVRGCSDREGAEEKLKQMKYTNIEYVDDRPWVAFQGGGSDIYIDEFKATPPGAEKGDTSKVDIVVTKGLFKGSTIRIK